jgi:hypothetical protein
MCYKKYQRFTPTKILGYKSHFIKEYTNNILLVWKFNWDWVGMKKRQRYAPTILWIFFFFKGSKNILKFISEYNLNGEKANQRIHQQFFDNYFTKKQKYFQINLRIQFKWCKDQPKNTTTILWKIVLKKAKVFWNWSLNTLQLVQRPTKEYTNNSLKLCFTKKQKYFKIDLRIHFRWYKDQPKNTPTILWKIVLKKAKVFWNWS